MNQKEVSEIRRRFRPDYSNITKVTGVYVSDTGEILSRFTQSVGMMLDDEKEKLLGILKRTLSGGLGKNLLDLSIPTQEVAQGPSLALLSKLRDSQLEDTEAAQAFFDQVIPTVTMETNYLILLCCDAYDVPHRGRDGLGGDSEEVYRYLISCVCPVKLTKSNLSFQVKEGEFHNSKTDWVVGAPELGFLYPAFDSRATNLYGALLYSRSIADNHEDFIRAVFNAEPPMAAAEQRETFQSALCDALEESCSMEVVQSVHDYLRQRIQEHKDSRDPEPLAVTAGEVSGVLRNCGVPEARVEAFQSACGKSFGEGALAPANLIDAKHFAVKTADATIQVDPERSYLVEARIIDGRRYLLVPADESVEVNGLGVRIAARDSGETN